MQVIVIIRLTALLLLITIGSSSATDQQVLTYSFDDEIQSGTIVANIRNDSGLLSKYGPDVASRLKFAFLTHSEQKAYFSLDERSGMLEASRFIDRDAICPGALRCILQLVIAVQPAAFYHEIRIHIVLTDANDNTPRFPTDQLTESLSESAVPGTLIQLPAATDVDSPPYGVQRYALIAEGDMFALVVRNSSKTGSDASSSARSWDIHIQLVRPLNREVRDGYKLTVIAYDGGTPEKSGYLVVDIRVLDENDNSPKFTNAIYNVDVRENLTQQKPIAHLRATDADNGDNGIVRYGFQQQTQDVLGHLFHIDTQSGEITLLQLLDYERQTSYTLHVFAKDQGTGAVPTMVKVFVRVLDVNDNEPQIIINEQSGDVEVSVGEESSAGTFVAHISVTDADSGQNGNVECALTESEEFTMEQLIDKEYTIRTTRPLDREARSLYDLEVICHDNGNPRKTTSQRLRVHVTDINDNAPRFTQDEYFGIVAEEGEARSFIMRVEAIDLDGGWNGTVRYRLDSDAGSVFDIDTQSGVIRTAMSLDREEREVYVFRVIAQDLGADHKSSSALVSVAVTDIDDQAPKFEQRNVVFSIYENQQPGSEIGNVMAKDTDLPPNNIFSYHLDNERSPLDLFRIDPKSGIIYTRSALDREQKAVYELVIIAQSENIASFKDFTKVTIYINDRNDNSPIIRFPNDTVNLVSISSHTPPGYAFTRLEAFDVDYGKHSELTFSISGGDAGNHFIIDEKSGVMSVNNDLTSYDRQIFTVNLLAKDNGNPARITTAVMRIAVNSSIPFHTADSSGLFVHKFGGLKSTSHTMIATYLTAMIGAAFATCILLIIAVAVIVALTSKRKRRHPPRNKKETVAPAAHKNLQQTVSQDGCSEITDPMSEEEYIKPRLLLPALPSDIPDITLSLCTDFRDGKGLIHIRNQDKDTDSGCGGDVTRNSSAGSEEEHILRETTGDSVKKGSSGLLRAISPPTTHERTNSSESLPSQTKKSVRFNGFTTNGLSQAQLTDYVTNDTNNASLPRLACDSQERCDNYRNSQRSAANCVQPNFLVQPQCRTSRDTLEQQLSSLSRLPVASLPTQYSSLHKPVNQMAVGDTHSFKTSTLNGSQRYCPPMCECNIVTHTT